MIEYPISFFAQSQSKPGINATWITESVGRETQCAIPIQFEGPGEGLSPEDLYAQALTNCFIATFKVFAEKSRIQFETILASTELIVDLNDKKLPFMKKAILKVLIQGVSDVERATSLAQRAFSNGFILSSVKTELNLDLKVRLKAALLEP